MINKTGLPDYKPWVSPLGVRISDTQRAPSPRDHTAEHNREVQRRNESADSKELQSRLAIVTKMLEEGKRPSEIQKETQCSYVTIRRHREAIESFNKTRSNHGE